MRVAKASNREENRSYLPNRQGSLLFHFKGGPEVVFDSISGEHRAGKRESPSETYAAVLQRPWAQLRPLLALPALDPSPQKFGKAPLPKVISVQIVCALSGILPRR